MKKPFNFNSVKKDYYNTLIDFDELYNSYYQDIKMDTISDAEKRFGEVNGDELKYDKKIFIDNYVKNKQKSFALEAQKRAEKEMEKLLLKENLDFSPLFDTTFELLPDGWKDENLNDFLNDIRRALILNDILDDYLIFDVYFKKNKIYWQDNIEQIDKIKNKNLISNMVKDYENKMSGICICCSKETFKKIIPYKEPFCEECSKIIIDFRNNKIHDEEEKFFIRDIVEGLTPIEE